jgi:MFS-type transporter involved in bile tolerance (Atg22 family)
MDGMFPLLLSLLYPMPALLAAVAALAWLLQKAPAQAPGRRQALAGAGLMLAASLGHVLLSATRTWMLHQASMEGSSSLLGLVSLFSTLGLLLGLCSAVGIALLGWGAAQAMSGYRASA